MKSVGLPIARGKLVCEFNFHLTVSITVVRCIETPQTAQKHPKPTQNTLPPPYHYRIYSQYHIMHDFFRTLTASWGGGLVPPASTLGPALALCKNTYSDRAKQPPAFLKSLCLFVVQRLLKIISKSRYTD